MNIVVKPIPIPTFPLKGKEFAITRLQEKRRVSRLTACMRTQASTKTRAL